MRRTHACQAGAIQWQPSIPAALEIRRIRTTRLRVGLATTLFAASLCVATQAAEITGAGSSFV